MSEFSLINGSTLGTSLQKLLMCDDIQPGSDLYYQLAKEIFLYHPLGAKMAEAPINMAQSQTRDITVQEAPEEVLAEFHREWAAVCADVNIHNAMRLSRVYGLSSLVLGCDKVPADKPIDMDKIWDLPIFFNALDPLNTAGSLVLSQQPNSPDFNRPVTVAASGTTYHRSRYVVMQNEEPVYLAYTSSAFGFVGRSVYQRALYPLKSFIRSMMADDLISTKLALLIAKQKSPGSIIDKAMAKVSALKRNLLKQAQTGNVLSIEIDEDITTLNMTNVDGAGTYSRNNILKNIATAADMPAKLLENETMVAGFGEGTEDAKNIARYIERIRMKMQPLYAWFDNIVQYRAWSPQFFEQMQTKYPDAYGQVAFEDARSQWRTNFAAQWPSLLIEPQSEEVKISDVKLQAVIAVLQTLLPEMDPQNKVTLIQSALDNISEDKRMFAHEFTFDGEALLTHLEEQKQQQADAAESALKPDDGEASKFGKFDSTAGLRRAVAALPKKLFREPATDRL